MTMRKTQSDVFISQVIRERAQKLCRIIFDITGKDVFSKSRTHEYVVARMMVIYQLRLDGLTEYSIGQIIKKDHTTVHYLIKKMKDVLKTPGYDVEREIWKEFKKRI